MEIEYKRVIYNIKGKPSPKTMLISIPMYMYRIKTKKYEYGLDFFQRAFLKFKFRPDVDNTTIAACLGLNEDLINQVQDVLAFSGYLTHDGIITDKGREMRNDSIIIDEKKEEIGYVFKFVNEDKCLPYYIDRKMLGESPNYNTSNDGKLYISVGTKGDGEDRTIPVFPLNFIIGHKRNLPPPNVQTIIDLISKTAKKKRRGINPISNTDEIEKSLAVSFIPENAEPDLVRVCTCVYLPQREDGLYEPEWQVKDPFFEEDNSIQLKFYLQSFGNDDFKKEIDERFGDAKTLDAKNFSEFSKLIDENVERIKEEDYDPGFDLLDKELQKSLYSIIKNKFILQQKNYNDDDTIKQFISSCQMAFETIFRTDQQDRKYVYDIMKKEYSTPYGENSQPYRKKRRDALNDLIRNRIIVMSNPNKLISLAKVEPYYANSLRQYIYIWLLTYRYDNRSILFKLIDGKVINQLFDIADLRNEKQHGRTESENKNHAVTKENVENDYSFVNRFINQYIKLNYDQQKKK